MRDASWTGQEKAARAGNSIVANSRVRAGRADCQVAINQASEQLYLAKNEPQNYLSCSGHVCYVSRAPSVWGQRPQRFMLKWGGF